LRLTYNAPLNTQTLAVRVQSDRTVRNVDLLVPGVGTMAMSRAGDRYAGDVPLPACMEAAEFSVAVTTAALIGSGDSDPREFPEAGRFTLPIEGQPPDCAEFSMSVSQTFQVDRREDFPDLTPGDGECFGSLADVSGCSLRAAVMEANARDGADLIRLPAQRYVLSRTGAETGYAVDDTVGDLDITDTVTIEGISGRNRNVYDFLTQSNDRDRNLHDDPDRDSVFAKVDGGGIDRVFQVDAGRGASAAPVVRLRNLAVVNGETYLSNGGAIRNDGTLVLERIALTDNRVNNRDWTGVGGAGGAIYNNGLLVAEDVAITHNKVENGRNPAGGAVLNNGTITFRRSLFAYNSAFFSSAIENLADAVMRLENTTIHGHYRNGGSVNAINNFGTMQLAFTTISGNRAADLISNTTEAGDVSDGDMTMRNVLIIDNRSSLCDGPIRTLGGNVTDGYCEGVYYSDDFFATTDHLDVTLLPFGALDYRGGFTPVYPISVPPSGSPSFNPVDQAYFPPFPFTDQRGDGFARNVDGDSMDGAQPDPGAYEIQ
jgi:hypothetical protein